MRYNAPLNRYELKGKKGILFCNECHRLLGHCYFYNTNKIRDDEETTDFVYAVSNKAPYGYKINGHYQERHGDCLNWLDTRSYFVTGD